MQLTKSRVNRMSLLRYINKTKDNPTGLIEMGYQKPRMIFTSEQELQLCDYAVLSANIFYGISPSELRSLAFEFCVANNIKFPDNWNVSKTASSDWMTKFMQRHKNISLRIPEATSLSRNTSFNKHNVSLFFDNLSTILDSHKFSSKDIWNIDETGTGTVQKPVKIIAEKGKKRVGGMTSAERGTNVTMVFGVNAVGNSVPPMFVFPRKFYKEHFIRDGPVGCYGSANPSGWITGSDFLLFMKHFVNNVRCSRESPVLVMLDNHASHLHIDVLDYCKDHGIIVLSFPPHTTHKLQPLDVSVFGPFKRFYNEAACGWMKSHPGSTISIYDVPSIVKVALPLAATPKNIQAGFRCTGIWEFNRNIFTDEDYLGSSVTDRPLTIENEVMRHEEEPSTSTTNGPSENVTKTSSSYEKENQVGHSNAGVAKSPIDIRPLPKSGPRQNKRARKSFKSAILTSTPIKETIRLEQMERDERKKKMEENARRKLFGKKKAIKSKQKRKTPKHIVVQDSESSEDEDCNCLVCLEPYKKSKKGEDWVQCLSCKKWSHVSCTKNEPFYVCVHCHSGADDTDDND